MLNTPPTCTGFPLFVVPLAAAPCTVHGPLACVTAPIVLEPVGRAVLTVTFHVPDCVTAPITFDPVLIVTLNVSAPDATIAAPREVY